VAEQSSADYRGTLVGRYALFGEIAAGGMATVHLARLLGPVGFARTVAIKRLHPHLAKDPEFVGMFLEEARLAARVRHPNVVSTLDVVSEDGELFLVMEYIAGESLSRLVRKTPEAGDRVPPRYAVGIMCGALDGLHAAHEALSEKGTPLGIVHRDVSPQNVHMGIDGVPRVLDFGIAKATNRVQETRTDQIKGKVAYMSPEQLAKGAIDRRADVYSASVVLWETLTGARLFKADDIPSLVYSIINDEVRPPSSLVPDLPKGLDEIVMRGLDREAHNRWPSARAMAEALEKVLVAAPPREIGEWVRHAAGEALEYRIELCNRIESETSHSIPPPLRSDSPSAPVEVASGVAARADLAPEDERQTLLRAPGSRHAGMNTDVSVVTSEHDPDAPRSRLGLILMAVAGLLLVGGGALFGLRWLQVRNEPNVTEGTPAAEGSESAIGIAVKPATSAQPSASVPIVTAPIVSGKSTTTTTASTPPKPIIPAVRPHVDDCDNPFTVDAKGIRHPKPHCFKK
jgi:eukaryotic-like serine/threonine-protein kinase